MCTPIGHSLGGMIAGMAKQHIWHGKPWMGLLMLLVFANLPDIDYLFGWIAKGEPNLYHRLWTHSLVFLIFCALLAMIFAKITKWIAPLHAGLVVAAIVGSHLFLDIIARDDWEPRGILLFWPFSHAAIQTSFWIFRDIAKSQHASEFIGSFFVMYNLKTVLLEIVILGPIVGIIRYKTKINKGIFGMRKTKYDT